MIEECVESNELQMLVIYEQDPKFHANIALPLHCFRIFLFDLFAFEVPDKQPIIQTTHIIHTLSLCKQTEKYSFLGFLVHKSKTRKTNLMF